MLSRCVVIASLFAGGLVRAETLAQVLARMDEAARGFRGMSGRVTQITHTAVINDDSRESGTIRMKRQGLREVRLLVDVTEPDLKSYSLSDRKVEIYLPKIQTVQVWDLSRHAQLLDQFLLLGFGTPSQELGRNYSIRLAAEETIGGQPTARLELIPKSQKVCEYLNKAELWVAVAEGRTVQQKFHEPSGDYRLVSYSDIKWNPDLSDSSLQLKLPSGVKREYPQK